MATAYKLSDKSIFCQKFSKKTKKTRPGGKKAFYIPVFLVRG
jgi:hypothetical protein